MTSAASVHSLAKRSFLWLGGMRAITVFVNLAVLSSVAKLLSLAEMGHYVLTLSLAVFGSVVFGLGVARNAQKQVSISLEEGDLRSADEAIVQAHLIFLGSIVLLTPVLSILAFIILPSELFSFSYLVPMVLLSAVLGGEWIQSEINRGFHRPISASVYRLLAFSSLLLVLWVSTLLGRTVDTVFVLWCFACCTGLFFLLSLISLLVHRWSGLKSQTWIIQKRFAQESLPLWGGVLTASVRARADIWVAGIFWSAEAVAVYGVLSSLAASTVFLPNLVGAVGGPLVPKIMRLGDAKLRELRLQAFAMLALAPMLLVLLVTYLFGQDIILFLYGESYVSGYWVLLVLLLAPASVAFSGVAADVLIVVGEAKRLFAYGLYAMIILIMALGLMGALQARMELYALSVALVGFGYQLLLVRRVNESQGIWVGFSPSLRAVRQIAG